MKKFKDFIDENLALTAGSVAYWIDPRGKSFKVKDRHITDIVKNPKRYGYTSADVKDIFDKHGEKLGSENQAREEIIIDLMKKGWIRIRRQRVNRAFSWSIEAYRITNKQKDHIFNWAQSLDKTYQYDDATMFSLKDQKYKRGDIENIISLVEYMIDHKDEILEDKEIKLNW